MFSDKFLSQLLFWRKLRGHQPLAFLSERFSLYVQLLNGKHKTRHRFIPSDSFFQLTIWSHCNIFCKAFISYFTFPPVLHRETTEQSNIQLISMKWGVCGPLPIMGESQKMEHSAQGRFCFLRDGKEGNHFVRLTCYSVNEPMSVNPVKAAYLFKLYNCFSLLETFVVANVGDNGV